MTQSARYCFSFFLYPPEEGLLNRCYQVTPTPEHPEGNSLSWLLLIILIPIESPQATTSILLPSHYHQPIDTNQEFQTYRFNVRILRNRYGGVKGSWKAQVQLLMSRVAQFTSRLVQSAGNSKEQYGRNRVVREQGDH